MATGNMHGKFDGLDMWSCGRCDPEICLLTVMTIQSITYDFLLVFHINNPEIT